jgi:hypothetical protein
VEGMSFLLPLLMSRSRRIETLLGPKSRFGPVDCMSEHGPRLSLPSVSVLNDEAAENTAMTNPAKNRLPDYEAGWLTLPVEMGVATNKEAHDAM